MGFTGVLTLLVAGLTSLVMAWSIGAGSSGSTPFAPAVGANAISVMKAGFWVGLLGFAGAVLQGASVSQTVGSQLIHGVHLTPLTSALGLFTAATLVMFGVFAGYPIATAFTVTGSIVGIGLAVGGTPAWAKYQQISTLWVLTPFVGGGAAFATARLLQHERIPDRVSIPLLAGFIGVVVSNIGFAVLGPSGSSRSIAAAISNQFGALAVAGGTVTRALVSLVLAALVALLLLRSIDRDAASGQRKFLLALGALVAFSAGGSQVGLAIGPLFPLLEPSAIPIVGILVGGGLGLLLGSWMGSPRMIKALAQDYSSLGPRRSIAALIPSFVIAQAAVLFGIPVSFNEIILSAIIGSGLAAGSGGVSARKVGYTVLAWVGSLVLALGVSYGVFTVFSMVR